MYDEPDLRAPPRPRGRSAPRDRRRGGGSEGDDLRLGARAGRPQLGLVLRARAGGVGRRRVPRRLVRAERRGLLPDLADGPRRAADRGGRAFTRKSPGRGLPMRTWG